MTVEEIVAATFGVETEVLNDDSSPEQIEEWDSIGHLNLVLGLEQNFGVSFSTDEIVAMQSIGKIKAVLTQYRAMGDKGASGC